MLILEQEITALEENASNFKQYAAWLRELQERREAPEIIRCGECEKHDGTCFCRKHGIWIHDDDFCSFAERRTE